MLRYSLARFAATGVLALALATPAPAQQPIKLRVAGNLVATGLIQQNKEQPFFENFAKNTGLPIDADYKPMDVLGVKDADGLRVLKSGLFDIVTLRLAQVSRDEPFLLGPDIVGLSTDYDTARKVVDAYRDAFDKRLQERHGASCSASIRSARRSCSARCRSPASPISRARRCASTTSRSPSSSRSSAASRSRSRSAKRSRRWSAASPTARSPARARPTRPAGPRSRRTSCRSASRSRSTPTR